MSPRRKSGLSKDDLEALKHLPAVLTALEHLQEQHAKVRALMGVGGHGVGMDFRAAHPMAGVDLLETVNRVQRSLDALPELPTDPAGRLLRVQQLIAEGRISWQVARRLLDVDPEDATRGLGPPTEPKSATLDTPERREYEEAKRNGRKVPVADPFANASPAQRERMAEQRAFLDAERTAKGPPARAPGAPNYPGGMGWTPPEEAEEVAQVARTEPLDTVSDGTTPLAPDADDDPEVH